MERYNMLTSDDGLRFMQSAGYQQQILEDPGFQHQNHGDFYSDVTLDLLANKVYDIMRVPLFGAPLNADLVVVNNKDEVPAGKDMMLTEKYGILLYSPDFEEDMMGQTNYELIGLLIAKGLSQGYTTGTLADSIKEFENSAQMAAQRFFSNSFN